MRPNVRACLHCGDFMNSKELECRNCGTTNTFIEKHQSVDFLKGYRYLLARQHSLLRERRKNEKDDKMSLTDEEKKIIYNLMRSRRYYQYSLGTRK
jgi:hypothetical protein